MYGLSQSFMTIIHKRIFWLSMVVLFLIISSLIVLYGMGFKYNASTKSLESTGILYVKTYPRDVNVWLNNELYANQTPWQKSRLLPGEYILNIEARDYFSWQKKIDIKPGETTFVEDVVLFKREPMIALRNFELLDYLPLANNNQVLIVNENGLQKIIILNLPFENFIDLYTFTEISDLKLISLSGNDKKLIYQKDDTFWLINLDYPTEHYRLSGLHSSYWQDFKWHPTDDKVIYSLVDNILNEIVLDNEKPVLKNQLSSIYGYFPYTNNIIVAKKDNSDLMLTELTSELKKIKDLIIIPFSTKLSSNNYQDYLLLTDQIRNKTYFLQLGKEDINAKIFDNFTNFKWYDTMHDKIAMWNNNEISIYFLNRDDSLLLLRTTDSITDLWWHPNGTYLFYQIDNNINLIELDERDKRNNYFFSATETNSPFIINNKGTTIYSYNHTTQTFYSMDIQ